MTENQKKQIDKMRFDGCGYVKIANAIGISENTVKSYCRRQKDNSKKLDCCAECGKAIDKSKCHGRRFCCDACRTKWWNKHPKVGKIVFRFKNGKEIIR